jgi:DNA repair protein RadD
MKTLYPHQVRYVEAAREAYQKGFRSILLCLPTGAGKTILAVSLCLAQFGRGGRILWVVSRIELVKQAAEALREAGIPCGIISPNHPRTFEAVQVASIDTLVARDMVLPGITMLVYDECQHAVAPTYLRVRQQYANVLTIGLSATPSRTDGKGLGAAFDCLIAEIQPQELVDKGFLVPVTVIGPEVAVNNPAAYPVDLYRRKCPGRQTIHFCASVKDAEEQARAFTVAGFPAKNVDGTMSADERDSSIEAYRSGRIKVLTNYLVLVEGFNVPETSCIIIGRKVRSESAYIQMTGRGMRLFPGKRDCLVLDLFGSSKALGILPTSPRSYSLDGKGVAVVKDKLQDMPQCPACGVFFTCGMWSGGRCPACGWVRPPKKNPAVREQKIVEYREHQVQTEAGKLKVEFLRMMLTFCRTQKKKDGTPYKPGYASMQFERKFGRYPNKQEMAAANWPTGEKRCA